jgi:hypothetical protein
MSGIISVLSAKNIVSHMTRDKLKCLYKNIILFRFSTIHFCTAKLYCYAEPCTVNTFEAIKPYISTHAIVTSATHIRVFVGSSGQNVLLTYCIHCSEIFTKLPNKHFSCGWNIVQIQFCVHSNRIARCDKCYVWLCIPCASKRRDIFRWSLHTHQADSNKKGTYIACYYV